MDLLKFALIWLSLTVMPGPDMLFVITESIKNGTRNGIKIALGLCSGLAFHSIIVLTGFGLVISKLPALTSIIKYLGAGYLVFIGIKGFITIMNKKSQNTDNKIDNIKSQKIIEDKKKLDYNPYLRGVIMNITNPKLLIFFLSFLPQFIDLNKNTALESFLIFAILVGIALPTFSIVAFFASKISQYFQQHGGVNANTQKILAFIEMLIYLTIAVCVILN